MGYIPVKTVRIANATTEMGSVLPIGATIYDVATKKTYKLTANNIATDTLTTLIANSKVVELGAGGGSTTFQALTDTPADYAGQGSKAVTVKADTTGLEFTTPSGATHIFGEFTYAAAIAPPPPIGDFIFNRSNPQASNKLYISDLTASGVDVRGSLLSMRVGSNFVFEDVAAPVNSMNFHVSAIIEHTGYVEYSVDHVHTTGTISAGHTFNLENIPAADGGVTEFISLTDTPSDYTGNVGYYAKVNPAEDALEFDLIDKLDVGLGNVDNTSDAAKPLSDATNAALDLKANLASPTFTGTVSGIDKAMVGLTNVDNTTDLLKPISTATQTALDLKEDDLGAPTSDGQILSSTIAKARTWIDAPSGGGGDVVGPAGAVNDHVPLFDGTTGKLLKSSGFSIDDAISGPPAAVRGAIPIWASTTGGELTDSGKMIVDFPLVGSGNTLTGQMNLEVVSAMPGTPDANTIYFVK